MSETTATEVLAKLYSDSQAHLTAANKRISELESKLGKQGKFEKKATQIVEESVRLVALADRDLSELRSNLQNVIMPTLIRYPSTLVDDRGNVIVSFGKIKSEHDSGALITRDEKTGNFTVSPTLNKKKFHIHDTEFLPECSCAKAHKTIEEAFGMIEELRRIVPKYLSQEGKIDELQKSRGSGFMEFLAKMMADDRSQRTTNDPNASDDLISQKIKEALARDGIDVEVISGSSLFSKK